MRIGKCFLIALTTTGLLPAAHVEAASSHLWWNIKGLEDVTCVYGEITVLASHPPIYYCGVNWHPGEAAGGYCGIQHNSLVEKRTIFSIWDTSPELHPTTTFAAPDTVQNRFGGEGEGGHTHMLWNWQLGETFQFFVQKQPGAAAGTTDARYFVFDPALGRWRHSATINSPNGDAKSARSVATIGGGLNSFLENFGGDKDAAVPKLALYRLWVGAGPTEMKCLTEAQGDGLWGKFGDSYYMAEGEQAALDAVFAQHRQKLGAPVPGEKNKKLEPISAKPLPAELVQALQIVTQPRPATRQ